MHARKDVFYSVIEWFDRSVCLSYTLIEKVGNATMYEWMDGVLYTKGKIDRGSDGEVVKQVL
jgi:hypothetical protein